MKVYWYECGRKHGNLGDKLTPLLLDYLGVPYEWSPPDKAALFGIGSILHRVPSNYRGIVWSTGALFREEAYDLSAARVLALRGKMTLSQVECCERDAVCLGDGGLLASLFFRPCRKRYKLGVIPHYSQADEPVFADLEKQTDIKRIDICDEPRSVVQQIGQCDYILSSSLHGLIIADSLGVPNRWVDVAGNSSKILGGGFKFWDYYSIFGVENPQPKFLRPGDTLDGLLPLFEDYRRPSIEKRKSQLLESFRGVVESHSRYPWDRAKQDIVTRQGAIVKRLTQHDRGYLEIVIPAETDATDSDGARQFQSFNDFRDILKRDSSFLGKFLLHLLSQLQEFHELGIVHGDIRDANILVEDEKPILTRFGWRSPTKDTQSLSHAHYVVADLRALGKLLQDVTEYHPHYATIASLLMQSQPNEPLNNAATACTLTQLLLASEIGSGDADFARSEFQMPELAEASRATKILLEALAARERKISSLRAELESARGCLWRTEARLAAVQVARIVPKNAHYILIDGDEWRNEFTLEPMPVPFVERNGAYWGPPADDDSAIRELIRLQRQGIDYVVFGKPAFWWLEYYARFRDYLNSSADCCHNDELLIVYRLRNACAPKEMRD